VAAARSDTVRPPLGQSFAAQPEKVKAQTNPVKLAYTIAGAIVVLGWAATRNYELVDPVTGTGYWLGIVGASLMALLLLYPVRKRIRLFRFFGPTRHWFRAHMVLGVVGPLLILYHCNFSFGSVNSTVALVCTLLVAGSGLVGRYLHAKVYASLDGHRRSISELIERAKVSQEQQRHVTVLVPDLISRMSAFDAVVMSPPEGFWQTVLLAPESLRSALHRRAGSAVRRHSGAATTASAGYVAVYRPSPSSHPQGSGAWIVRTIVLVVACLSPAVLLHARRLGADPCARCSHVLRTGRMVWSSCANCPVLATRSSSRPERSDR
jgi:hypothetical protein